MRVISFLQDDMVRDEWSKELERELTARFSAECLPNDGIDHKNLMREISNPNFKLLCIVTSHAHFQGQGDSPCARLLQSFESTQDIAKSKNKVVLITFGSGQDEIRPKEWGTVMCCKRRGTSVETAEKVHQYSIRDVSTTSSRSPQRDHKTDASHVMATKSLPSLRIPLNKKKKKAISRDHFKSLQLLRKYDFTIYIHDLSLLYFTLAEYLISYHYSYAHA